MIIEKQKIIDIASKCLNCNLHPCNSACTLKMPINKILNLIKQGDTNQATNLIYRFNAFPFVTGSLCDHEKKCYGNCVLSKKNNSVDYHKVEEQLGIDNVDLLFHNSNKVLNHKVAIVGGGICGMTIAIRLLQNGIKPIIFDKNTNLGGILSNALPSFRYDKNTFNKVVSYLNTNLEVQYNKEFGKNLFMEDLKEFDDIIFSYGCYNERSNFDESYKAITLLHDKKKLNNIIGHDVIVIGGGNVAMDIARTLARQNNNVIIAYRRNIANSPASVKEIRDTINEGVVFHECISPLEVLHDNSNIIGMKFQKMELYDNGATRLMFKPLNETVTLKADMIIEATGSSGDYAYLKEVLPQIFNSEGWIKTNNDFMTSVPNIYVGGDLNTGPKDFCSAIHSGEVISNSIINKVKLNEIQGKEIVIGGSFNPPTIAHHMMLKELYKLNPSKITLLPNGDTYKVSFNDKTLIPFNERFNMCQLLIDDLNGNFEINDLENQKEFNGIYYTLQKLNHPYFVIGSDCLFELHKWIKYRDLVKENKFIVFTRKNNIFEMLSFIKEDEFLNAYIDHFIFLEICFPDVSSSKFRNTLDRNLVTPSVYEYIKNNKLFEVDNDK